MDYRSVLVLVDTKSGAIERLAAACRITAASQAILSGAFLNSTFVTSSRMRGRSATDSLLADERWRTDRERAKAQEAFDRAAREGGIETSWLDINGDLDIDLVSQARLHDLTIMPRRMTTVAGDHALLAERVGVTSGGPILVLPEGGYPWDFGRKIMLAWKDGREAARVLRDAWPFLRTAEEIHVVTAAREGVCRADGLLQRQLELHGCRQARFTLDHNADRSVGELIHEYIGVLGVDMVVLGLSGDSHMEEFVLGGVSQHLLDHSPMPLLMSH